MSLPNKPLSIPIEKTSTGYTAFVEDAMLKAPDRDRLHEVVSKYLIGHGHRRGYCFAMPPLPPLSAEENIKLAEAVARI